MNLDDPLGNPISVTFISALIRFLTTSYSSRAKKNDKLHRRKFTRAADEKLIINGLGPYIAARKLDYCTQEAVLSQRAAKWGLQTV